MGELISLNNLPLKDSATISFFKDTGEFSERLSELGFIENTEIRTAHRRHENGVAAYEIMGSVFALRAQDAEKIMVIVNTPHRESFSQNKSRRNRPVVMPLQKVVKWIYRRKHSEGGARWI